jgi:hypothetical protein
MDGTVLDEDGMDTNDFGGIDGELNKMGNIWVGRWQTQKGWHQSLNYTWGQGN